jgi:hypothetical protein
MCYSVGGIVCRPEDVACSWTVCRDHRKLPQFPDATQWKYRVNDHASGGTAYCGVFPGRRASSDKNISRRRNALDIEEKRKYVAGEIHHQHGGLDRNGTPPHTVSQHLRRHEVTDHPRKGTEKRKAAITRRFRFTAQTNFPEYLTRGAYQEVALAALSCRSRRSPLLHRPFRHPRRRRTTPAEAT